MPSIDASSQSHLRWRSKLNLYGAFSELRKKSTFCDISLSSQNKDGRSQTLRAHRLILSTYSSVFEEMISQQTNPMELLIYLKGVQFEDLESLIDFMYDGDVSIPRSREVLSTAEEFKIKGLYKDSAETVVGSMSKKSQISKKISNKDMNEKVLQKSTGKKNKPTLLQSPMKANTDSKLETNDISAVPVVVISPLGDAVRSLEEDTNRKMTTQNAKRKEPKKATSSEAKRVKRVKPLQYLNPTVDVKDLNIANVTEFETNDSNQKKDETKIMSNEDGIKVNDLVIATVRGFKPWPAKVTEIAENGACKVNFYVTLNVNFDGKKIYPTKIVKYTNDSKKILEKDNSEKMFQAIDEIEAELVLQDQ